MIEDMTGELSNSYISGNVEVVDIHIMKVVVGMNTELLKAVANKVNDEDSIILWDILNKPNGVKIMMLLEILFIFLNFLL